MADNDDKTTPTTSTGDKQSTAGANRRRSRTRGAVKAAAPDPSKLKFFTLIPDDTRIDFTGTRNRTRGLVFSLIMMLIAFGAMLSNYVSTGSALNYGIDFQGGSTVRIALAQEADIETIRDLLDDGHYPGSSVVAVPDAQNEIMIRVKEVTTISETELVTCREALAGLEDVELLEDGFVHPNESSKIFMKFTDQPAYAEIERLMTAAGCEGTASSGVGKPEEFPVEYALIGVGVDIAHLIDRELGAGTVDHIVASETVGAKVGSQLKRDGVQAMVFAIGFIFLFVMIRFDLRFAPGGIVALVHDAIIVVGAFALTGKEFNLQSIAAVLTIIGYSINDTIVVFDRVRERVSLNRDAPIEETTNTALNETLSRTVLTSATTMIVVLSTWILGSGPIKDFAFALFVGLLAGTYSSLFVASPVFLWINKKMYKGKGHLITTDAEAERGTGTLLGPQVDPDEDEDDDIDVPDADSVLGPQTGSGPQASADVQAAATGESIADSIGGESVKIEDVDKQGGERKSRRRRRRPKQD